MDLEPKPELTQRSDENKGKSRGEIDRAQVNGRGRGDVEHLGEATDILVRETFLRVLKPELHTEGVIVAAKIGLLDGFSDTAEQAERPRPVREVIEEGGRFHGRAKAVNQEDVTVVCIAAKICVHMRAHKRDVREAQEFDVGGHGGSPCATAL